MKPAEKESYPAGDWTVEQVIGPDGTPYKDIDESPVLVLGDSFTTFFAEDSGGISAHLAKELGMPVSRHSHFIPLALDPGAWHRVNALLYPRSPGRAVFCAPGIGPPGELVERSGWGMGHVRAQPVRMREENDGNA